MNTHDHPTRAMAVANWFLEKSWNDVGKPYCDQMKLYKLVYYSHAWYMGNCRSELFPEDVEAWPHGPVVRDLYSAFKDAGRGPIRHKGKRLEASQGGWTWVEPKHDGSLDSFFDSIWDVYGGYTGIQLSNMTHETGEPWTIVAEKFGFDLSSKPTIQSEIIEATFAAKVQESA